jgi:hypothetical protein
LVWKYILAVVGIIAIMLLLLLLQLLLQQVEIIVWSHSTHN